MFKHVLAAVLVGVVSGCVTQDRAGSYSQSMSRQARAQQIEQAADKGARSPKTTGSQVILGAAY